MNAVSISALVLLSIVVVPVVNAQDIDPAHGAAPASIMVGPALGMARVADRARLGVFAGSFDCGVFRSGEGLRISAGGEMLLPRLLGERWAVAVATGMDRATGGYSALPAEPARIIDRQGELVELRREYRQRYREVGGYLMGAVEYSPLDRWGVGIGAALRYTAAVVYEQREVILGPGSYTFADGAREHAMPLGDVPRRRGMTVEPILALSYMLPIAPSLTLRPRALFSCEIAPSSGSRLTTGGSLALLFALPGAASYPTLPDAPPLPPLAASLVMLGIDGDGSVEPVAGVEVRELAVHEVAPLLPAVFFERDAHSLPLRYGTIDPLDAPAFSPAGLAGIGVYELQHRTLDVIGARLAAHPAARVTLAGITSGEESGLLGRLRAEFVADYLKRVWGMGSDRVMLVREGYLERSSEQTEDGRADNRRVEIAGSVDDLLAPVVTERVERELDPPAIRLDPIVTASAGVRRWAIIVMQGRDTVARYAGEGSATLARTDVTWSLDGGALDQAPLPVIAVMTVEDSSGAVTTARVIAPLVVRRHVRRIDGGIERMGSRERIAYSLVGFDFDADAISPGDEAMLREIARMTRPGAVVTITGHTDRIGDQARNLVLSSARARNAASVMRAAITAHDVRIEEIGGGMETTRFSNDTPEGRMLSRGASVVVEQDAGGPLSDDISR